MTQRCDPKGGTFLPKASNIWIYCVSPTSVCFRFRTPIWAGLVVVGGIVYLMMLPWGARRRLLLGLWQGSLPPTTKTLPYVRGRYRDDDAYKASVRLVAMSHFDGPRSGSRRPLTWSSLSFACDCQAGGDRAARAVSWAYECLGGAG